MNTNAYTSTNGQLSRADTRGGFIVSFDPDKRLYVVDIDGKGLVSCKQIDTGILRPYEKAARVMVSLFLGSEWVIIGELPTVASTPAAVADSREETLAVGRGRLVNINKPALGTSPSYRPVDSAGESDVPVFSGDTRIENKTSRATLRSFFHIFSFGDILIKTSSFCYIHLNKLRSTLIVKARNLYERYAGYTRDVVTPAKGDLANRTTVVETYQANPLSSAPDITIRSGDLTSQDSLLVLGQEHLYPDGYAHTDLTSASYRNRQKDCIIVVGEQDDAVAGGSLDLPNTLTGRGVSFRTKYGYIYISDDGEKVTLALSGSAGSVLMTESSVSLNRKGQNFKLNDSGIEINATNLKINVAGDTTLSTGSALRLAGATIDLN